MQPHIWRLFNKSSCRIDKTCNERKPTSNVRYCFPFSITLEPLLGNSSCSSDDVSALEKSGLSPLYLQSFSIDERWALKPQKQPSALVSIGCVCSICVPGQSKFCQMTNALKRVPLAFLDKTRCSLCRVQTWKVRTCQVIFFASWIQHIQRTILIPTETGRTT